MITNRKLRLVGISAFLILLLIYFVKTSSRTLANTDLSDTETKAQTLVTSNNLIDSKNDDKVDAAINNEISKLNDEETEEVPKQQTDKLKEETKVETSEKFDPAKALMEIRSISPMVIISKTYCPYSKKIKKLLHDNYQITPEPTIVEIDKHENGPELQEYLGSISGRSTVPNVLVGNSMESRGGCDDFIQLHDKGQLLSLLNEWGNKKLAVKKIEAPSNS